MSSKDEKENEKEKEREKEKEKENEKEKEKENDNSIIKQLNVYLDEIIDKSKSFEDKIKSMKKLKDLNEYYYINDYGDKNLEFKIFKLKPYTFVKYHWQKVI